MKVSKQDNRKKRPNKTKSEQYSVGFVQQGQGMMN
jgi:hypothetical protein